MLTAYYLGLDLGQTQDFTALAVLQCTLPDTGESEAEPPEYALRHLQRFPLGTPYTEIVPAVARLTAAEPLCGSPLVVDQTGVGRAVVDMLYQSAGWIVPVTITGGHAVTQADDVLARRKPAYALRHLHRFPLGTPYPVVTEGVASMLGGNRLSDPTLVVDQTGVGRAVVDTLFDGLRSRVACVFFPVTLTAGHVVTGSDSGGLQVPKKELVGTLQILLQSRRLQVARTLPQAAVLVKELENFRVKVTTAQQETFESWREGRHDDLVLAVALAAWMGEQTLPTPDDLPEETVLERFIVA